MRIETKICNLETQYNRPELLKDKLSGAKTALSRASLRRLKIKTQAFPKLIPTITERYLEKYPIEKMVENCSDRERFLSHLPLLREILKNETSTTFGYHGASRDVRIFQDAVRVIFEEILEIEIPENFHFLRIPGDNFIYQTENIKRELLDFQPQLNEELCSYALDYFVLNQFNNQFGCNLASNQLSIDSQKEMKTLLIDLLKKRRQKEENPMNFSESIYSDYPSLCREISEHSRLSFEEVQKKMDHLYFEESADLFICHLEKKLDVIDCPHPEDRKKWEAFLLRQEKRNQLTKEWCEFANFFGDTNFKGSSRVISVVGPLFYAFPEGESAVSLFLNGGSYENNDRYLESLLENFCQSLGLPKGMGRKLMKEGEKRIAEDSGVLFQFFSSVETMDRLTYLSPTCGFPIHRAQRVNTSAYIQGKIEIESIEIRLIMDNATCLNPNGPVKMIRYDTLSKETGKQVLDAMRNLLKEASKDKEKINAYKERLSGYFIHK